MTAKSGTVYDHTKHPFEQMPNNSMICRWCKGYPSDELHHNVGKAEGEVKAAEAN